MGFEVVKNNPIIGVGFGDIMNEVSAAYATKYPDERPREPHSYWLFTAVGVGIVGLAIWLAAILTPVFYQKAYQNGLFMYFNTVFIIANTVDYIFEGAIYSAFYAFATGLFLNYFKNKNTHDAL
jgi:O-antigen ligase